MGIRRRSTTYRNICLSSMVAQGETKAPSSLGRAGARTIPRPCVAAKWAALADHPLVGETRISGFMGAIELTPDKSARASFANRGQVGLKCREFCFGEGLVMRAVGDTMISSPPLSMSREEIDMLVARAWAALDKTAAALKSEGIG